MPLDCYLSKYPITLKKKQFQDELIGTLVHLLMCAIEDPGVPNPLKQLTLLGQNLRQVR